MQKARWRKTASWLRERVLQLGPTFIKLGQQFSTRSDLFPEEFVQELAKLQVIRGSNKHLVQGIHLLNFVSLIILCQIFLRKKINRSNDIKGILHFENSFHYSSAIFLVCATAEIEEHGYEIVTRQNLARSWANFTYFSFWPPCNVGSSSCIFSSKGTKIYTKRARRSC